MSASKDTLRNQIRTLIRSSKATLVDRSKALRSKILELPEWKAAQTIGLFASLPDEPDLVELMIAPNKTFAFPCIVEDALVWRRAITQDDFRLLQPGIRHLREPQGGPVIPEAQIQLLLVPGLAFTKQGFRLGRGGGFYDRALQHFPRSTIRAGVCFQFQILDSLPVERHDQPVDFVLHD